MIRTLIVLFAMALACAPAQGQRGSGSSIFPKPDSIQHPALVMESRTTIADMKAALHGLVDLQEKYFKAHGTYTTEGSALGIFPSKSGQPVVQVIFAGGRGWSGIVQDSKIKGRSCVVFVGFKDELPGGAPRTHLKSLAAEHEAIPVCDEP
jgi:hypothetical protein